MALRSGMYRRVKQCLVGVSRQGLPSIRRSGRAHQRQARPVYGLAFLLLQPRLLTCIVKYWWCAGPCRKAISPCGTVSARGYSRLNLSRPSIAKLPVTMGFVAPQTSTGTPGIDFPVLNPGLVKTQVCYGLSAAAMTNVVVAQREVRLREPWRVQMHRNPWSCHARKPGCMSGLSSFNSADWRGAGPAHCTRSLTGAPSSPALPRACTRPHCCARAVGGR
jgi:hypothetical protein